MAIILVMTTGKWANGRKRQILVDMSGRIW